MLMNTLKAKTCEFNASDIETLNFFNGYKKVKPH